MVFYHDFSNYSPEVKHSPDLDLTCFTTKEKNFKNLLVWNYEAKAFDV